MHNDVLPFNFGTSTIRAVMVDGEPWFVARDVAEVLGYSMPRNAVRDFCEGSIILVLPSAAGFQSTTVIPERDVYYLVMHSKVPAAEQFEEWVVGTVLPSLR